MLPRAAVFDLNGTLDWLGWRARFDAIVEAERFPAALCRSA
jgi:hypothetical protein